HHADDPRPAVPARAPFQDGCRGFVREAPSGLCPEADAAFRRPQAMTNAENLGVSAAQAVKKKASGSSFYLAMRLMPVEERDAMFAIYAFCRKVDDIADDGVGTRAERHEKLEQWRADLRGLYAGAMPAQVRFLAPAVKTYGLRLEDFLAVLDGMAMDVAED